MKYKLLHLVLLLLFISCSPKKNMPQCNENSEFKAEFFKRIKCVDDYLVLSNTEFKDFEEYERVMASKHECYESSLRFISKYTHVSWESMANYDRSYPFEAFEEDKAGWLKWYEVNKCANIQLNNISAEQH